MTSVKVMMACARKRLTFDTSIKAIGLHHAVLQQAVVECSSVHRLADTRPSNGRHTFTCRTRWDSVCQGGGLQKGLHEHTSHQKSWMVLIWTPLV